MEYIVGVDIGNSSTEVALGLRRSNGDFRFKPELKFDGEGVAGDPRWWAN